MSPVRETGVRPTTVFLSKTLMFSNLTSKILKYFHPLSSLIIRVSWNMQSLLVRVKRSFEHKDKNQFWSLS